MKRLSFLPLLSTNSLEVFIYSVLKVWGAKVDKEGNVVRTLVFFLLSSGLAGRTSCFIILS